GFRDFHADRVAGVGKVAVRQFNVGEIELAVDFRRHALQARLPYHRIVRRWTFKEGSFRAALPRAQALPRNFLLDSHQPIAAVGAYARVNLSVEYETPGVIHV